jgi:hypothetical protein
MVIEVDDTSMVPSNGSSIGWTGEASPRAALASRSSACWLDGENFPTAYMALCRVFASVERSSALGPHLHASVFSSDVVPYIFSEGTDLAANCINAGVDICKYHLYPDGWSVATVRSEASSSIENHNETRIAGEQPCVAVVFESKSDLV